MSDILIEGEMERKNNLMGERHFLNKILIGLFDCGFLSFDLRTD